MDDDLSDIQTPHEDALIILARISRFKIGRVMIDTGSNTDIMYNHAYEQIKHKLQWRLRSNDHYLYSFNNHPVKALGIITLPIQLGDGKHITTHEINFLVVDY